MTTARSHYLEKIFFDGQSYFAALLADISAATKSVDIETYIFELDEIGSQVLAALKDAAKRGVLVRILVDSAGSPDWPTKKVSELESFGAETRVFHPFPWRLWQWSRSVVRLPLILKAIYLLLKINSRNHRKVCIIDGRIAYIGSFNICSDHLLDKISGDGWRDTGVRLEGAAFQELQQAYEAAWFHLPIKERLRQIFKHIRTNPVIRLNNTWQRRRILYKNLLRRIRQCKHRIWITNAYFIPDNFLLRRLKEAAQRKVDVRILLPNKSDVPFMPWASNAFYENLLKSGVRIFEYLPTMLHAKTLILDNWMTIGSSNLNYRSLLHDFEVDINIRSLESKNALEKQFLQDLTHSKEINLIAWQKRSWHQRMVGRLLLYLKYLI
ncbi:MAG: phospholipase D-like domain-containing protein [Gammaproteobacteria bacterium]|nr:phospholipase D-like domain-containing protein [Gammaproteobacteria bacterium]